MCGRLYVIFENLSGRALHQPPAGRVLTTRFCGFSEMLLPQTPYVLLQFIKHSHMPTFILLALMFTHYFYGCRRGRRILAVVLISSGRMRSDRYGLLGNVRCPTQTAPVVDTSIMTATASTTFSDVNIVKVQNICTARLLAVLNTFVCFVEVRYFD